MIAIRKGTAIVLSLLVLCVTIVAVLAIWGFLPDIPWGEILSKFLWSLVTIFIASVVLLFIHSVLYRANEKPRVAQSKTPATGQLATENN